MSKRSAKTVPLYKLISNKKGKNFVRKYWVNPEDLKNLREKQRFDSKDKHTNSTGQYHDYRITLHDKIINDVVEKCPFPKPGEKPRVILLSGGAASGKSTVVNQYILPKYGNVFGTLNVDEIKEEIPEYNDFVKQDVMTAATRVHEESSDMGKKALKRIVEEGRNLIYDAVLGNSEKAKKLITDFQAKGYEVELVSVTVDTDAAWERSVKRGLGKDDSEDGSGRFVPQEPFFAGHRGVVDTFENIKGLLNNYKLFDNNVPFGSDPILIENSNTIVRPELKEKFLSKKDYFPDMHKALELDLYLQSFDNLKKAFDNDLISSEKFIKARNVLLDIIKSIDPEGYISFGDVEYDSLSVNDLMDVITDNREFQHYCDSLVINSKGQLLIVQRPSIDYLIPDKWCLPGGKAEQGEFLRDAVKRELYEETMLITSNCNYSTLYRNGDGSFSHYFWCYCEDLDMIGLDSEEIQRYAWINLDDIEKFDFIFDLKDRIKQIFNIPFKGKFLTVQELAAIASNKIEKGARQYQVGEVSAKTGMKKVAPGEWIDPKTGQKVKSSDDPKTDKMGKEDDGKNSKLVDISKIKDKELREFAKNSSESDLQGAIKSSREPRIRKIAQEELARREKEEKPKDDKDKEKPKPKK